MYQTRTIFPVHMPKYILERHTESLRQDLSALDECRVSIRSKLWAGQSRAQYWQAREMFLFAKPSRPALGHKQLPGAFYRAYSSCDMQLTIHLHLVLRLIWVDIHLYFPCMSSWHGQGQLYVHHESFSTDDDDIWLPQTMLSKYWIHHEILRSFDNYQILDSQVWLMSQLCDSLATTNKKAQWKHDVRPEPTDHLRNKSFWSFLICSTLLYETLINTFKKFNKETIQNL